MKCPRCGADIAEGSLFCEKCFADIRVVPTYDSQIEQRISETLSGIAGQLDREEKREERRLRRHQEIQRFKRRAALIFIGFALAVVLMTVWFRFLRREGPMTESAFVGNAYAFAEENKFLDAAEEIQKAIDLQEEPDTQLLLKKAEYLRKAGEYRASLDISESIIAKAPSKDDVISAYRNLVSVYSEQGEYDIIAAAIADEKDASVRQAFSEYLVYEPEFSNTPGEYADVLNLALTCQGIGTIFYTMDGSVPDTSSILYNKPIPLRDGEYTISAVFVNHFGAASEPVTGTFVIGEQIPAKPELLLKPGFYDHPVEIGVKAELGENETIRYTTDGSVPTADSEEYTGPIPLPEGTATYRFAVISKNGVAGEIAGGEYTYSTRKAEKISQEDAAARIIAALTKRGETIAPDGTIGGGIARFSYACTATQSIGSYGDFYIFEEYLTDQAGNTAPTGRKFAVNQLNGTVNLYDNNVIAPI